jgi:hypothetical protein
MEATTSSTRKIVYVFSLDQIWGSDLKKSEEAFASSIFESDDVNFVWKSFVGLVGVHTLLVLDQVYHRTIDSYKKGEIDTQIFRNRLRDQLGVDLTEAKFDDAWNRMCKLEGEKLEEGLAGIERLATLKEQNPNVEFVIVSGTNELQFEYIIKQIQESGINGGKLSEFLRSNVVLSYQQGTLDKVELLAVEAKELETQNCDVISLHRDISQKTCQEHRLQFTELESIRTDPKTKIGDEVEANYRHKRRDTNRGEISPAPTAVLIPRAEQNGDQRQ